MNRQLINPKFYLMILGDIVLFCAALIISYLFRFEFNINQIQTQQIQNLLFWIIPLKLILFFNFGLYRGMWRYTGLNDFWKLSNAAFFSTLLIMGIILFRHRFQGFSRAVFLIDGALTFLLAGGVRMLIRFYFQRQFTTNFVPLSLKSKKHTKKILIIGAGDAGEKIFREISENQSLNYQIKGFFR